MNYQVLKGYIIEGGLFIVWSQDCCDLRRGRLDNTLFIGYVSSWK